jgi:hypothetical protein
VTEINWDVVIGEPGWSDGLEPYPAFRKRPKAAPKPKTSVASRPMKRQSKEMPLRASSGGKGGKGGVPRARGMTMTFRGGRL